jgi:hypothetical protein
MQALYCVAQTKATVKTTVIKNEEGIVTRCEIHNGKHKKNQQVFTNIVYLFIQLAIFRLLDAVMDDMDDC